jgi:rare lipoprotein A
MKKQNYLILFCCIYLAACGGGKTVKPPPAPSATASKPATAQTSSATKPGGYYLDDGPGDNPPKDIDSIPNAVPKKEPLLDRANKPYKALDVVYTPMTNYQPYKVSGVASWYGKRYHGKNTSSGEVYDMYSMSAAHPTLPLPSYVKVTNPANGRFVVVRVNDRGPFKSERVIDLSYAAAYKLRFSAQGSTLVQVEAIDTNNTTPSYVASYTQTVATTSAATSAAATSAPTSVPVVATNPVNPPNQNSIPVISEYFIQAGAFRNEANADSLIKKIQGLEIEQNAGINKVYNNGLHRLKLGPYDNKQEAEQVAANIRKQLNISTIITNQ